MTNPTGSVTFSIDLELDLHQGDQEREQRLDAVRSQLIAMTWLHRVAATWAVADPRLSAATDPVLGAGIGHELAVLGDRTWIGHGAGRARLARELTRRVTGARGIGIPVSTLALRNVAEVIDLDLLLDHGLCAVRGPAVDSASRARGIAPSPLRYGLWQAPTAWRIPPHQPWWRSGSWQVRRQIQRAIRKGTLLHLQIDAPRLVESGPEALAVVESALHFAGARRDQGQLTIQTLGQLATDALASRAATPTRSVLRPAA